MRRRIHLAFCCLLLSMLLHANAIQQEPPPRAYGNDAVLAQDADGAMATLSALTNDDNPAETRSLCGSRSCGKTNCSACTPKNDCCTKLQCRRIITTLDVVESKVCLLTECEPIPLSPSDVVNGTLTINQPGFYCLCCDIGTTSNNVLISIAASQVTLDMNCHQLTGRILIDDQDDVFVTNGVIDANDTAAVGVEILNASNNIHLSELTVRNATGIGINAISVTDLFVSNVLVEDNGSVGLFVRSSENAFISNSVFFNNERGLRVGSTSSTNVVVENCQSISNSETGFSIISGSQRIYFYNCTALDNGSSGFEANNSQFNAFDCVADKNSVHGFDITEGFAYFERCLAQNNTENGFNVEEATVSFERCIAQNNTENGFEVGSSVAGTISQCLALRNTVNGFTDTGPSSVKYISNYAQNNDVLDYDPAIGAPFNPSLATDAGISFWYNTRNA